MRDQGYASNSDIPPKKVKDPHRQTVRIVAIKFPDLRSEAVVEVAKKLEEALDRKIFHRFPDDPEGSIVVHFTPESETAEIYMEF